MAKKNKPQKKSAPKAKPKKFAFEKAKKIEKPKKADFDDRLDWEKKQKKIEKPKKTDFVKEPITWKIPWLGKLLKQRKIEKPLARDFANEAAPTKFPWEEKEFISKPRATDFKEKKGKSLKWHIPWLSDLLEPKKIEEPSEYDFVEKKEKKILVGEEISPARSLLGQERETVFEEIEEERAPRHYDEPPVAKERDWLATAILLCVGVAYLVFIILIGAPYVTTVTAADNASLLGLFYALTIISIILSLFFCAKKNVIMGFFLISVILVIYMGLSLLLAKNLFDIIGLLLIVLAILPIEAYNVRYNSEK